MFPCLPDDKLDDGVAPDGATLFSFFFFFLLTRNDDMVL